MRTYEWGSTHPSRRWAFWSTVKIGVRNVKVIEACLLNSIIFCRFASDLVGLEYHLFSIMWASKNWKVTILLMTALFKSLPCPRLTVGTPKQDVTSLTSFWSLYCYRETDFTHGSGVSIVDFEPVNTSWIVWKISAL